MTRLLPYFFHKPRDTWNQGYDFLRIFDGKKLDKDLRF
jgi:hypothetical protein